MQGAELLCLPNSLDFLLTPGRFLVITANTIFLVVITT